MKDKYTPGQDCKCHAYSESECACDVDWTPTEVHELRAQLKAANETIKSIQFYIDRIVKDNSLSREEARVMAEIELHRENMRGLGLP